MSVLHYLPDTIKQPYRLARAWALSVSLKPRQRFQLSPREKVASSKVSVVVPVHNAPVATSRCLAALAAFAGDAEVVLVDDASNPEVARMLADAQAQNGWMLVRHEMALGHSRACEAGVAVSTRPYVCLLNSDAIVSHRSWVGIVDAFESSDAIAIVGPSTSYTVGPQTVRRAMHCRHYWTNEQTWSFAERYVNRHDEQPLVDRPFVGGFAFFVRRSAWDAVDGFDKNLPDYGNEVEFCRRIRAAGFRVFWSRRSYVHHLGKESYGVTFGKRLISGLRVQAQEYIDQKYGQ